MTIEKIYALRRGVREKSALVHCITNPISINQCANAILAVGAKPVMAEHPAEVAEIAATARAILINLGNITDVRMESMKIVLRVASDKSIPVVLDAVGVACSGLRKKFANEIIKICPPAIIKGNYSEINALCDEAYKSAGVDADILLTADKLSQSAKELSLQTGAVVCASGKKDIITDGNKLLYIHNGCSKLSGITGSGCMLGALTACYLTSGDALAASISACAVLGISGEMSAASFGSGSFAVNLMDNISNLKDSDIASHLKMEMI